MRSYSGIKSLLYWTWLTRCADKLGLFLWCSSTFHSIKMHPDLQTYLVQQHQLIPDELSSPIYTRMQETYGKSGCRRVVPGQFVAVDPKGRACMIAAVEKQKFVYILNRDPQANVTISSPLEAHKSHNLVFSVCGLDCGFDNPIFAAIELDYSDADQVGAYV